MPCLSKHVDPDQLASEEANWSGSALFVIYYINNLDQGIWLADNENWAWHLNIFSMIRVKLQQTKQELQQRNHPGTVSRKTSRGFNQFYSRDTLIPLITGYAIINTKEKQMFLCCYAVNCCGINSAESTQDNWRTCEMAIKTKNTASHVATIFIFIHLFIYLHWSNSMVSFNAFVRDILCSYVVAKMQWPNYYINVSHLQKYWRLNCRPL